MRGLAHRNSKSYQSHWVHQEPSLEAWLTALRKGHAFFSAWTGDGNVPNIVSIAAFTDPSSVFFAEMERCAVEANVPLAEVQLHLDCAVPETPDKPCQGEAMHLEGLAVQGAVWNVQNGRLEPPQEGVHSSALPVMYMACQVAGEEENVPGSPASEGGGGGGVGGGGGRGGEETTFITVPLYPSFARTVLIAYVTLPASSELWGTDTAISAHSW